MATLEEMQKWWGGINKYGANTDGVEGAYAKSPWLADISSVTPDSKFGVPIQNYGMGWGSTSTSGAPSLLGANGGLTSTNPMAFTGSGTPPPVTPPTSIWESLFDPKGVGGMIKGGLDTGVGIFNAWMGQKNQKFLQNYYGQQQNMQRADFANNANMTNLALEDRISNRLNYNGVKTDSPEGKAQVADYMSKWRVKDSF